VYNLICIPLLKVCELNFVGAGGSLIVEIVEVLTKLFSKRSVRFLLADRKP